MLILKEYASKTMYLTKSKSNIVFLLTKDLINGKMFLYFNIIAIHFYYFFMYEMLLIKNKKSNK